MTRRTEPPDGATTGLGAAPGPELGAAVLELVAVMDRLRSPGGCPWDAEQTHQSLARHLLEETYEVLEALDSGDRDHLREELGDLLLQVVFHARLAQEHPTEPWGVDEVARGIIDKLVARHPHVFAAAEVRDAAHVEADWERHKVAEKGRTSVLDGIPAAMPALARADKLLGRLDGAAVDSTLAGDDSYGVRLFALAAEARAAGVDPEGALRSAVTALAQRVDETQSTGQ
ncbi:MAG: MazG family protein [Nocardioidaceae bacterium]|nr:MazG family protein [Nocardioidaceae bacterium]